MTTLFGRKYELLIGDSREPLETKVYNTTNPLVANPSEVTQSAIKINSVRMAATITSSKENGSGASSPCTISLYNLSKDTKAKIQQGFSVFLYAGYATQESLSLIFTGQVGNTFTRRDGADLITEIVCADSAHSTINLRIGGSLPPKSTYLQVFNQIIDTAKEFKIPVKPIDTSLEGAKRLQQQLPKGHTYEGFLLPKLSEVAVAVDYRVYLSLGTIHIEPKEAPSFASVVRIGPDNIKGQLQPVSDNNSTPDQDTAATEGVTLVTFLDGRINLDRFIEVVDRIDYNGTYQPFGITHRLDTEGDTWDTEISLRRHNLNA